MVRKHFDDELSKLHIDLIQMGALIEEAIDKSISAFENFDKDLANQIIIEDKKVDDLEKAIETRCLRLLMRQQPVATDLRTISVALKIITDMERIGDQASDIAEISKRFTKENQINLASHLPKMSQKVTKMVHQSVEAFVNNDVELAREVIALDDEVDKLFCKVKDDLITVLKESSDKADSAIDIMMIAKYLERIGDHAENIGEWVEFFVTGEYKNTNLL